jgi:hypothetical protein
MSSHELLALAQGKECVLTARLACGCGHVFSGSWQDPAVPEEQKCERCGKVTAAYWPGWDG